MRHLPILLLLCGLLVGTAIGTWVLLSFGHELLKRVLDGQGMEAERLPQDRLAGLGVDRDPADAPGAPPHRLVSILLARGSGAPHTGLRRLLRPPARRAGPR